MSDARSPSSPSGNMACPACGVALVMSDRQGVEIDYCPKCRGVWLDRGELDKLIELSMRQAAPPPSAVSAPFGQGRAGHSTPEAPRDLGLGRRFDDDDDDYRKRHGQPKRKSWLGELFD